MINEPDVSIAPTLPKPAAFDPGLDGDARTESAAQFLWDSGLNEIMAREASDPYEEDSDIQIGSGREGNGVDYAERALTESWYEITDGLLDNNLDYLHTSNESSMDDLIGREIGSHGALSDAWESILDTLREPELADDFEGTPFDEDDFEEQVTEKVRQLAIDEGVDRLHEISHRLTGACGGSWSGTFNLGDGSPGPWLPNFKHPDQAADAAHLLSLLNIHPLDFAQALNSCTVAALALPDCWDDAGLDDDGGVEEAEAGVRQLLEEFMGGCASQPDPAQWTGGMGDIARAFALNAWSLPRAQSAPAASAADVVERLVATRGSVDAELIFDAEGSELQEHSDLIDRFDTASPVCGEALARASAALCGAELYLDGEAVALAGPVPILVSQAVLQSESAGDKAFEACMASRRQAARRAQQLSWAFKSNPHEPPGGLSARDLKVCSEMACDEPVAFETAEASARARGAVDEARILAARELVDLGRAARAERLAKRGKTPDTLATRVTVEDFDVRAGALASAPWRHALPPELALEADSLGNTLAHKAVVCLDPLLLRFALAHAPASADARNLAGRSLLDLIHLGSQHDAFISLATELLNARPDLANTHAGSHGRALTELAASRGHASKDLTALAAAGCSLLGLSRDGSAWWNHWAYKSAEIFKNEIPPMLAAGWDINTRDGSGRTLAHYVSGLDAALVLLELGADFSTKNHDGETCGARLSSAAFSQLEKAILLRSPEPARPRVRPKSL